MIRYGTCGLTEGESAVILAALRHLSMSMAAGEVNAGDAGVGEIMTNGGRLPNVTAEAVDDLADRFLGIEDGKVPGLFLAYRQGVALGG